MMTVPRVSHHRRFTDNHTWHVDTARHNLFVKANPRPAEAAAEAHGHGLISSYYPVPRLHSRRRLGRWTVLVYDRWPHLGTDHGLLLDEITMTDLAAPTASPQRLDKCLSAVLGHYRTTLESSFQRTAQNATVAKLYGQRAAPGGRLDDYYADNAAWLLAPKVSVRPAELATHELVVNGRSHRIDFGDIILSLRAHFTGDQPVWAAISQGDPTDINIGYSPSGGPVWFDYDTGGLNAVAGELACFLMYQRLHGTWLTPHYNPEAFRDHPRSVTRQALAPPAVQVERHARALEINYQHAPTPARRYVLRRYVDQLVTPLTTMVGVDNLMEWLRPYLVMRILAVYPLTRLEPRDTALSLALLAEVIDRDTTLPEILGLTTAREEASPA